MEGQEQLFGTFRSTEGMEITWSLNPGHALNLRVCFVKAIPSGDLTKLVDPHLDSAMLAELLQVLSVDFVKDGASPINYLLELAKCRELGILAMMMGTEERKAIAAIVDDEKRRHERSLQTISKAFSL